MSIQSAETKDKSSKMTRLLPKGVAALFLTQAFSTLSFGVVSSTLVLYTTNALGFSLKLGLGITATFTAFNFVLHLLGGYMGGRWLSYRSLFCIGMLLLTVGCFGISVPSTDVFYWGLAAFLAGTGLNVTCINCMLTQLFSPQDKRREAAFLWNYSGMNLGFFVGFTMSGYFHLHGMYETLFSISAAGNLIAFIVVLLNWKALADRNTHLVYRSTAQRQRLAIICGLFILALIPMLHWALLHEQFSNNAVLVVGAVMAITIAVIAQMQPTKVGSRKIWAFLIFGCAGLIYFTLYQLLPMGLTLFIEHNVTPHVLGFRITPQWVQNINPFVVIVGGPLLTIAFAKLRNRGINISIPFQISVSLLLVGMGFGLLPIGIKMSNAFGYTSFGWVAACYVFQATGEMMITPIGYAMIGQLIPVRLQGVMMGSWMMISGVAAPIASYFSKMAAGTSNSVEPLLTNPTYAKSFTMVSSGAIVGGIVMFLLIPTLQRLMGESTRRDAANLDCMEQAAN